MNKLSFAKLLNYPAIWLDMNLLTDELFEFQSHEFQKEYGNRIPKGGTEHWRYGAFHYWLARDIDSKVLWRLLEAASVDPNQAMAGAAIKDIIKHPSSNSAILTMATDIVSQSPYFYVSAAELEKAFEQKKKPLP